MRLPAGTPGMEAGTDYSSQRAGYADVGDEGPYEWELTDLVRAWVRLDQPNFGMVLRDATGYDDRQRDWRDFESSQGTTPSRRPMLTVIFNPKRSMPPPAPPPPSPPVVPPPPPAFPPPPPVAPLPRLLLRSRPNSTSNCSTPVPTS